MSESENRERIAWRDWNETAFQDARREEKHVLLTLTATWCHWCHVMDQTTYSDSRVIDLVNSKFIPVAVDVDRRPDLSRRYNQGGFPSFVFLTGAGDLVAGRIYTPPDEMLGVLESVLSGGPAFPTASRPEPTATGDGATVAAVVDRLEQLYDPEYGGFGVEPKQPPWESLRLLLALYGRNGDRALLERVEKTLAWMKAGIYDFNEDGFFRYSVSRDWKVPHYEKMLVTNANLALTYLEAALVTGKRDYRETASGVMHYLTETLRDPAAGWFWASQDATEEYYQLPWKDRAAGEKPPIDRVFYTGWNALAADALLQASAVLGAPAWFADGESILNRLWAECWSDSAGLAHVAGEFVPGIPTLADQVWFLRALLTLCQTGGQSEHLQRAEVVARTIQDLYGASEGGFYDIPDTGNTAGPSLGRERSLLENSLLAEGLITLHWLTGDEDYLNWARGALQVFQGIVPGKSYLGSHSSHRMEEDEERLFLPAGSAWARAWDLLHNGPVRLVVVGNPASSGSLRRAAQRLPAPHRITQFLDPARDEERIAVLGFPVGRGDALYACMGATCLAPVSTAAEVRELAKARPWRLRPQPDF